MKEIELPPFAPSLIESMRAIGYSLEAAVADIIDNSLAADASRISILFDAYRDDPYIAIVDDGTGLSPSELTAAMQHGSKNPNTSRSPQDLGRFGLGLKTASLSQCRRLTVISLKDDQLSARRWDLDVIGRSERWTLLSLEATEIGMLPHVDMIRSAGRGTIVLWQELDRLRAGEPSLETALSDGMLRVRSHLALVFHRFLSAAPPDARILLLMNDNPVQPSDPFLDGHRGVQKLQDESFEIEDSTVLVQPFILPHYSRMTEREKQLAAGEDGLLGRQGFYIYRNKRLIIGGTWFRLARREELTKLARIRVDIPNSLDHLWTLDIKKSVVSPPAAVRSNLARTVERIAGTSREVFRYRGRATQKQNIVHVWQRMEHREGITYEINRNHPIVESMKGFNEVDNSGAIEAFLRELENTLPLDAIYADLGSDAQRLKKQDEHSQEELLILASEMLKLCPDRRAKDVLLSTLPTVEPFSSYPDLTREIIERVRHA